MSIKIFPAYNYKNEIRELFAEYTKILIDGNISFKKYLEVQNYDEELQNLDKKYGMPYGRLYIAYESEKPAGCIGLRRIDNENCEMKRLYVRPDFRGKHIGNILVKQIISDAKDIGYSNILLDTLPFLKNAVQMYKNHGFYEIPPYNDNPIEGSIFMKLEL